MTDEHLIATDQLLSAVQRQTLVALLDTMIPASEDGRMPGAGELDLLAYLNNNAADFLPLLVEMLDGFDENFPTLDLSARYPLAVALSELQPDLFQGLLLHTYACYYQQDQVLEGIGLAAGPPFPRGNTVEPGDLSLLDPVIDAGKGYRK